MPAEKEFAERKGPFTSGLIRICLCSSVFVRGLIPGVYPCSSVFIRGPYPWPLSVAAVERKSSSGPDRAVEQACEEPDRSGSLRRHAQAPPQVETEDHAAEGHQDVADPPRAAVGTDPVAH